VFGTSAHQAQRRARAEVYAARRPAGAAADVEDKLLGLR
jgi:hypothetical protein